MSRHFVASNQPVGKCTYCGCRVFKPGSAEVMANKNCMATRDHVMPQAITSGAGLDAGKTVLACGQCNNLRAYYPSEVFQYFIRQRQPGSKVKIGDEWHRFVYLLLSAGFSAAMREALRPQQAPAAPVRDDRGRYTIRDLRKRA